MQTRLLFGIVFASTFLLTLFVGKPEWDARRLAAERLRQALGGRAPAFVTAHHDGGRIWTAMQQFYTEREYEPAWIDGTRPSRDFDALLRAIGGASRHGLDPELYDHELLSETRSSVIRRPLRFDGFEPEQVAPIDLRLTAAWFSYAHDLATGVLDRPHADPLWRIRPASVDLPPALAAALDAGRVEAALEDLAPQHPEYRRLMDALERTRAAGHSRKAAQVIAMNLERWRWFPRALGARHIRVNVPGYQLQVREGDATALAMRVIVGTSDNPTPIFSDTMTTIVFSPYWNVPPGIASEETLPAVLSDPEFLARNNIEVVSDSGQVVDPLSIDWTIWQAGAEDEPEAGAPADAALDDGAFEGPSSGDLEIPEFPYRFRQRPGTWNSLGLVKFLFPNPFDVYLHDTPASALFKRRYRALSHGCVRVQEPVKLAEYLLRHNPAWTRPKIEQAMHAGTERHVTLEEPLPVHLMYWTAAAGEDGAVTFFADIYGYDARQWQAYQARVTRVKRRKDALPRGVDEWITAASKSADARQGAPPRR